MGVFINMIRGVHRSKQHPLLDKDKSALITLLNACLKKKAILFKFSRESTNHFYFDRFSTRPYFSSSMADSPIRPVKDHTLSQLIQCSVKTLVLLRILVEKQDLNSIITSIMTGVAMRLWGKAQHCLLTQRYIEVSKHL
jgi:hypothetical protein